MTNPLLEEEANVVAGDLNEEEQIWEQNIEEEMGQLSL